MERIQIDTFLKYKFVSDPTFSPDAQHVAFLVSQADLEMNGYKKDLYLYDMEGKTVRPLTSERGVGLYLWSDRDHVLFTSDSKPGKTSFYEISISGGEAIKAFELDMQVGKMVPMEDGRYVLLGTAPVVMNTESDSGAGANTAPHVADREYEPPAYEIIEELPFWSNGRGFTNRQRTGLYIYDRDKGTLEKISGQWEDCSTFSLRGHQLLFKSYEWQDVRGTRERISIHELDSQKTRILMAQDTMASDAVALLSDTEALVAATDGSRFGDVQYPDFYRMDLTHGTMTLAAVFGGPVGYNSVGSDARLGGGQSTKLVGNDFYFLTTDGEDGCLRCLDQAGKVSGNLTGAGSCDSFDMAGGHCVTCQFQGDDLAELYVDGVRVTHFNDMSAYTISRPGYHEISSRDGMAVHGFVMKPVGYEPGKKYPAILHIHGGPRTAFGAIFHHEMQVWANAGYFVLYCNPHGSDGRGDVFGYIDGSYGSIDYDDIMDFTDAMLAAYPDMDAGRLGVAGGSYGGFMTNWIIGHTDRFKAAVSQRCVTNWISMEHMSDIGHFFVPQSVGADTATNMEKMWDQSPLKYAANCKTPTLFIHSDNDFRCPLTEGIQMFSALKLCGCEARLCVIKGENHELSRSGKPKNRIKRMEEILSWMDSHLACVEEKQ